MVHRIVWRVGDGAIDFWADRLEREGVEARREAGSLAFSDFEGLTHELAVDESGDDPLIAEHPEVPAEHALRGFAGVRAYANDTDGSKVILEQLLGGRAAGDDAWELRGARRGGTIAYDPAPEERGRQSAGTVHHIAWGTTVDEHPRWQERFDEVGLPTSGIIDRHYFHSIYFREPSGVLFEIADDGPGFTVDVPLEELGSKIILPPKLEPRRAQIEAGLTPLPDPRAARTV
jgi:glyoxalase family protein